MNFQFRTATFTVSIATLPQCADQRAAFTTWTVVYSFSPSTLNSTPMPEHFTPPNGFVDGAVFEHRDDRAELLFLDDAHLIGRVRDDRERIQKTPRPKSVSDPISSSNSSSSGSASRLAVR
jgi:hypothetical protein